MPSEGWRRTHKMTVLKAAFALVEHIEGFRLVLFQLGDRSLSMALASFQVPY